jgi:hypothetical protein
MPLRAVLKTISLFLSLAAFLVVGINSLSIGEELLWAVGKAFVVFIICWLVINWLAGLLSMSVEGLQYAPAQEAARPAPAKKKGGKKRAVEAEE